jgi:hypothetical protein
MRVLFGNFDPTTESSDYDVPQTTVLDLAGSNFKIGDDIAVWPLRTLDTNENGRRKVILLTFAVPKDTFGAGHRWDFDCHACAPLIGAAVFVHGEAGWSVESSRTVISSGGGFGHPPSEFRIVAVGPHKIGIEMTDGYSGQGEETISKVIMVAWNGKVNMALRYVAADNNKGGCGADADGMPCYANHRRLEFVADPNRDYYDILLRLSGTDLTEIAPYRSKAVRGWERYTLQDGNYKMVERVGDGTSVEQYMSTSR